MSKKSTQLSAVSITRSADTTYISSLSFISISLAPIRMSRTPGTIDYATFPTRWQVALPGGQTLGVAMRDATEAPVVQQHTATFSPTFVTGRNEIDCHLVVNLRIYVVLNTRFL